MKFLTPGRDSQSPYSGKTSISCGITKNWVRTSRFGLTGKKNQLQMNNMSKMFVSSFRVTHYINILIAMIILSAKDLQLSQMLVAKHIGSDQNNPGCDSFSIYSTFLMNECL
ncbi:leukocyte elastase inhibitor-like [Platysternon megacephalum]|uniref:Leukocyte elastase inhibitor-like n=1 Tax=Platysternon megacephalum TaxID=55544 RepID=A0A4D9EWN2_9SAUR|nr:leukocyte elastase inhibitor-like [Platysternon megacephalum]